jgi:type IV secretion system protein VirD4
MQLPSEDELVLVSGVPPIRAKKARYFEDRRLAERVLPPPELSTFGREGSAATDDWSQLPSPLNTNAFRPETVLGIRPSVDDPANSGIRREPELPEHENVAPEASTLPPEFDFTEDEGDGDAVRARVLRRNVSGLARQAAMDPGDGLEL